MTDDKWHFSNLACKGTLEFKLCPKFGLRISEEQKTTRLKGMNINFSSDVHTLKSKYRLNI